MAKCAQDGKEEIMGNELVLIVIIRISFTIIFLARGKKDNP